MRTFVLSFFFFIILSFYSSAQNWFPLEVGNKYQVKIDWLAFGPGGYNDYGTNFKSISILNDTLINGKSYYTITNTGNHSPFPGNIFYSYDSLEQKLLVKIDGDDNVRLGVDFNAPADSHYISYILGEPQEFISRGITSQIVLGDTQMVYKLETPDNIVNIFRYDFANKIGLSYFQYFDNHNPPFTGYESKYNIISAIVDSTVFNSLVLKIDSLYPIINRPIDTFPFLLSITYHVNYYQLINYFYLSMEVERDSNIVFEHNYDISLSNPYLQINPSNLHVGDNIKLKVTISDSSIYNNIDYYPDTSWVVINVLPPILGTETKEICYTYKLEQNYPNPFNPSTIIRYEIPEQTFASLKIYDILGNEVATLANEEKRAGSYEVVFNSTKLSSGVYIYKLQTTKFIQTNKMILIK